jgi:NAD(P)-dependent dehydrogenase (short-subunit alcohol dehydrogenase family)
MSDKIRTYQGSVSIITGGASGIGRAIGTELAKRGAQEIVICDLQTALAEEAAEEYRRAGSRATVVTLDVRDKHAVERMVADVHKNSRRIDYVFNNAGTGVMGETHHLEERDWDLTIDVNLHGVVNVIRSAYPRLIEQGFGHLVNTASVAGLIASPFISVYVATKHAVLGLSKSMRIEAAPHGVRVTALCPGAIRTPILTGGALGGSVYEMSEARKLSWWERFRPGDVHVFAKETMDLVAKNEGVIILPRHNRVGVTLFRMFPALEEIIGKKLHQKTLEQYPEMKVPTRSPSTATARAASASKSN